MISGFVWSVGLTFGFLLLPSTGWFQPGSWNQGGQMLGYHLVKGLDWGQWLPEFWKENGIQWIQSIITGGQMYQSESLIFSIWGWIILGLTYGIFRWWRQSPQQVVEHVIKGEREVNFLIPNPTDLKGWAAELDEFVKSAKKSEHVTHISPSLSKDDPVDLVEDSSEESGEDQNLSEEDPGEEQNLSEEEEESGEEQNLSEEEQSGEEQNLSDEDSDYVEE